MRDTPRKTRISGISRRAIEEDLLEVDPATAVLQQASVLPRPTGGLSEMLRLWSANAIPRPLSASRWRRSPTALSRGM
ncbi:hypothetical protein C5D07_04390 [Rathayibacter tritici]|nr:hypothetical protein C5C06_13990 [Rathayibacter tritici]PPI17894.1 hypothetical protein C5D07_04390 [Rathayibacter tritici]